MTDYLQEDVLPALEFPALCIKDGSIEVAKDADHLTETNRLGLKRRAFDDLLVVGSNAVATRVTTARKLHGGGRFGGHNLFFNQEIRAELTFAGPSEPIALDEGKRHVLRAFEEWEGWSTRGDWDSLPGRIERAGSVHQIIRILGP